MAISANVSIKWRNKRRVMKRWLRAPPLKAWQWQRNGGATVMSKSQQQRVVA